MGLIFPNVGDVDDGIIKEEGDYLNPPDNPSNFIDAAVPVTQFQFFTIKAHLEEMLDNRYHYAIFGLTSAQFSEYVYELTGHPGAWGNLFSVNQREGFEIGGSPNVWDNIAGAPPPYNVNPNNDSSTPSYSPTATITVHVPDTSRLFDAYNQCFLVGTPITMWPLDPALKPGPNGIYDPKAVRAGLWTKPIEDVARTDLVISYDDNGNMVPGVVDKLFTNTTQEFITLDFSDSRDDLTTTPGHRFLTQTGDYMEIGHVLRRGGGTAQLADAGVSK